MRTLQVFAWTRGLSYINLQWAAQMDELFDYAMGAVMFLATLKLIGLFRLLDQRVSLMADTLRMAAGQLASYMSLFSSCLSVLFLSFTLWVLSLSL